MQWFKDHTSLRHNKKYRRLSDRARQAFDNAMRAAAEYEQGDSLATDLGPLDEDELAYDLIVKPKYLNVVLSELESSGFFVRDGNVWRIAKFEEKTGTSTERVRRHRQKKRLEPSHETVSETVSETQKKPVTETRDTRSREIEIEIEDTNVSGDPSPKQPSLGVDKPSDLDAYRILDAAWPVISGRHDLAIKRADWRTHNKRAAKALAANDKTPEAVVAMLEIAYEHPEARRFYGGITTLAKLIEHWPKLAAIDTDEMDESDRRRAIAQGDFLPRA